MRGYRRQRTEISGARARTHFKKGVMMAEEGNLSLMLLGISSHCRVWGASGNSAEKLQPTSSMGSIETEIVYFFFFFFFRILLKFIVLKFFSLCLSEQR